MISRLIVIAAVLFAVVIPARAEETLDELKVRLAKTWEPWKGCDQGSWIQMRTVTKNGTQDSAFEYRQTLKSRDEKGLTIETRTVKRSQDADGKEVIEFGEPQSSVTPNGGQAVGFEEMKDVRHEDVEVSGKKINCRVVEATYVYKMPAPQGAAPTEFRTKMTMWISSEIQEMGGLVKTETDSDSKAMGSAWSSDMKLVETVKEMKIGGSTVKCSVYRYGSVSGKEETASSGELWMSTEVPSGYAKMTSEMNYTMGASKTHLATEMEITGMEIVKAKKE
ncbi:MAG: hypothetical protein K8T20_00705 [Planctomycetes bacterium]|nr:hypothetical protein [Planctomycetota bacterium]